MQITWPFISIDYFVSLCQKTKINRHIEKGNGLCLAKMDQPINQQTDQRLLIVAKWHCLCWICVNIRVLPHCYGFLVNRKQLTKQCAASKPKIVHEMGLFSNHYQVYLSHGPFHECSSWIQLIHIYIFHLNIWLPLFASVSYENAFVIGKKERAFVLQRFFPQWMKIVFISPHRKHEHKAFRVMSCNLTSADEDCIISN